MKLNEHWKKGCKKVIDDNKNQLTLKLYLPLKNVTKGIILAKGGNVLEYMAKLEASSKPLHSCTIVTKTIPPMQQKRKKEKNFPLDNFNDDVSDVVKHGLTHKKNLTTLGSQKILEHIKRLTRNLQLQFLPKSNLGQSKRVQRFKQSKPSKHEGELQSKYIQQELQTPSLPTHKLQVMPKDRRKKVELKKIMCENATQHEANDMFQELSKRKQLFGYKLVKTLGIWHLFHCNPLKWDWLVTTKNKFAKKLGTFV